MAALRLVLLVPVALLLCTSCDARVSARTLLSLFVPAESTACTGAVQGSCTVVQQAEPRSDACSQQNAAQLAKDITNTDQTQVCQDAVLITTFPSAHKLRQCSIFCRVSIWCFTATPSQSFGRTARPPLTACQACSRATSASTPLRLLALEVRKGLLCSTQSVTLGSFHDSSNLFCCSVGEQAGNLLWRLQNGEVFIKHAPKVAIVLIGTNDLGAASCGVGESGVTAAASGLVSRLHHDQHFDAHNLQILPMPCCITAA